MEKKELIIKKGKDSIKLPYFQFGQSRSTGDIFISAGIHGDEVNGVYGVSKVLQWFNKADIGSKLNGRVLVFPILNPSGFRVGRRSVPEDRKDLNRQFGSRGSTISVKIANEITKIFSQCAMGVDIHDAGYGARLLPHARIHLTDEEDCISCSRSLARVFGTEYILERMGHRNMMAVHLNDRYNTPVITVEIGGSRIIDRETSSIVLKGVKNLLVGNRFIDGEMEMPPKQFVIRKRAMIQSKHSGIIRFEIGLGSKVVKDQLIANLYDPTTDSMLPINAPKEGVIFSIWPTNQITKGRTIFSIVSLEEHDEQSVIEMENYIVKPYDI